MKLKVKRTLRKMPYLVFQKPKVLLGIRPSVAVDPVEHELEKLKSN